MAGKDDKDGPRLLCKPFHGQRGPVFDQWNIFTKPLGYASFTKFREQMLNM